MKKFLLFPLMAILANNAYANNNIDMVKKIVSLAESGDIFNLTKTAEHLNLKDEIYRAEYKPVADDNSIFYKFPIKTHQVIESISYDVSFGGLGDYDLTTVYKNVKITFKKEHCPSIDGLQKAFGEKLWASERLGPPRLRVGAVIDRACVIKVIISIHLISWFLWKMMAVNFRWRGGRTSLNNSF